MPIASLPGIIGSTTPGATSWVYYNGPAPNTSGLYVDIDYSSAGFTHTPLVLPVVTGSIDNWVMQVTVGNVTATGCRIYIRSTLEGFAPDPTYANANNWTAQYAAVGNGIWVPQPITFTWTAPPCDHV